MHADTKVSAHGGHSGQFCSHASDSLEDIVKRYIALGFDWVCLTEHMPPPTTSLIPAEELAQGHTVASLRRRFCDYFSEARRLQNKYQPQLDILVGFETDACAETQPLIQELIDQHQPDMLVGSVHHVHNLLIDAGLAEFSQAQALSGSLEALYCDYFDLQLQLIERWQPEVVGHFDLIRLHDPDYPKHLGTPAVRQRVQRNLQRIEDLGLILDLNVRALGKGATEPYLSEPAMNIAITRNMAIAPGDDAHSVASVGAHLEQGVAIFQQRGGTPAWTRPQRRRY